MKTNKFKAFNYFETDDEIMDYLSDCYKDDDPQLFILALSHLIEKKGIAEVAKLTGLNSERANTTNMGNRS